MSRPRPPAPPDAEAALDAAAAETPPPLPAEEEMPVAVAPAAPPPSELEPLYAAAIAVLTWGFRVGAALLTIGVALTLVRGQSLNREADPFADVLPAGCEGRAAGIVALPTLWLMIPSGLAVVVVVAGFLRAGDRRYALLSLLVLAVLGVSIALTL